MKCIYKKLKENSENTFYPLTPEISTNLEKNYNIKLMNKTIREIYEENPANNTRDPSVNERKNIIIQQIFDNNEDIEAIKILNTKLIDFINRVETKEYICTKIENKDKKSKDIKSYMIIVKQHLEHFEEWFTKNRRKKVN